MIARCPAGLEEVDFIKNSLSYMQRHRDCILKFGRFPSRNKFLGRISTPEQIQYLEEHPFGLERACQSRVILFKSSGHINASIVGAGEIRSGINFIPHGMEYNGYLLLIFSSCSDVG